MFFIEGYLFEFFHHRIDQGFTLSWTRPRSDFIIGLQSVEKQRDIAMASYFIERTTTTTTSNSATAQG